MKRMLILLALLLQSGAMMAQIDIRGWYTHYSTFRIPKSKFSVYAELQYRLGQRHSPNQTIVLRPGLNYHINESMTASAGYAHIDYTDRGAKEERRIWQQFAFTHPVKMLRLEHRARLEQRFLSETIYHPADLEETRYYTGHRFRYQLRGMLPFNGDKHFTKGMYAALQDEVFIDLNKNSYYGQTGISENRMFVGPGYRFSRKFDLELGYMHHYTRPYRYSENRNAIQLTSYLRL